MLHYHGAVDGFGHVSVRHPENPGIYIMCGYMPPALVESVDDLIEYYVDGSAPVSPDAKKGYSERFIHGELFKRFPQIQAVVHSHAEAVLPFTVGAIPMKPLVHMSGFFGRENVKVWDISPLYSDEYQQDMLVNNAQL
jgi:ribulose-5-phosphate 4-epimerase/fuculose-1-phosphate aldolase